MLDSPYIEGCGDDDDDDDDDGIMMAIKCFGLIGVNRRSQCCAKQSGLNLVFCLCQNPIQCKDLTQAGGKDPRGWKQGCKDPRLQWRACS